MKQKENYKSKTSSNDTNVAVVQLLMLNQSQQQHLHDFICAAWTLQMHWNTQVRITCHELQTDAACYNGAEGIWRVATRHVPSNVERALTWMRKGILQPMLAPMTPPKMYPPAMPTVGKRYRMPNHRVF